MDIQPIKILLHTLVITVLYVIFFIILIPPLIAVLPLPWGKVLYGVLVAIAVGLSFRLRLLSQKL